MPDKPHITMTADQWWHQISARTTAALKARDWQELALCVRQLEQHPDTTQVSDHLLAEYGQELAPYRA